MTTAFDEWLRQLGVAKKGPVRLPPVTRGRKWTHQITLEGDWTGAALRGQVRTFPQAQGSPLTTFTITGPVVDSGFSAFTLSLSTTQTGSDFPADGDADAVAFFPFDLLLTPSGGDEDLLIGGALPVLGRVTA